jgi:hypothetical protein
MIIAVDFDGTLCEHVFPEIGKISHINTKIIKFIRDRKALGDYIILYTCREDYPERKYLTEAINWCKLNNVPIDFVNENAPQEISGIPTDPKTKRKIYADVYIDDRALNLENFREE